MDKLYPDNFTYKHYKIMHLDNVAKNATLDHMALVMKYFGVPKNCFKKRRNKTSCNQFGVKALN